MVLINRKEPTMYQITYFRKTDGAQIVASFRTREQAARWAIDTGRPGAKIVEVR